MKYYPLIWELVHHCPWTTRIQWKVRGVFFHGSCRKDVDTFVGHVLGVSVLRPFYHPYTSKPPFEVRHFDPQNISGQAPFTSGGIRLDVVGHFPKPQRFSEAKGNWQKVELLMRLVPCKAPFQLCFYGNDKRCKVWKFLGASWAGWSWNNKPW